MSKAIMIADKPIWCAKIMNEDKTIEVRRNKALYKATKKLIEEQGYATFFMYCSQNGGNLVYGDDFNGGSFYSHYAITRGYSKKDADRIFGLLNGKVVAKFTVRKVEKIYVGFGVKYQDGKIGITYDKFDYSLLKKACLTEDDLINYLKPRIYDTYDYYDTDFFAYHIEDLVIFDKPKELSEFKRDKGVYYENITKAPQNFCYVESEE